MKVNSMNIVVAVSVAVTLQGCCWLGCGKCGKPCDNKTPDKCCNEQRCIGVKANVGNMGAGAGVSPSGAHVNATTGRWTNISKVRYCKPCASSVGLVCFMGEWSWRKRLWVKAVNTRTDIIIFVPCCRILFRFATLLTVSNWTWWWNLLHSMQVDFKAKKEIWYGSTKKHFLQVRYHLHCGSFRIVFRMHVGTGKGQWSVRGR